jgi:hypothetical protein
MLTGDLIACLHCRVRWTLPNSSHLEAAEALVQDMRGRGAAKIGLALGPIT